MAINPNLCTAVVKHPDADVDNTELTFPIDQYEDFIGYVGKYKGDGFNMRTLTPRNRYGAAGMPIEAKRAKLLAMLAELEAETDAA